MLYNDKFLEALDHDASVRRYYRDKENNYLLMKDPSGKENIQKFIDVAEYLSKYDIRIPKIYEKHIDEDLLIIEDFGDNLFGDILRSDIEREKELYNMAIDVLIHMQKNVKEKPEFIPDQDINGFLIRVVLFLDYFYKEITGKEIEKYKRHEFIDIWKELLTKYGFVLQKTVVHYDYHCDNLMLVDGDDEISSCGVIDFWDARWGEVSFDLMSLLDDARSNISDETKFAMIEKYLDEFPEIDRYKFMLSYKLLSAKRACKVLGVFVKLGKDDKKYLKFIPKAWETLLESLDQDEFQKLRNWLDNCFIMEYRDEINNYLKDL